jgi:protein-ribulosamine 3-kinase
MVTTYQQVFESVFFECFGRDVEILDFSVAAAGVLNTGARVVSSEGVHFVKLNQREEPDFFGSEADDLLLLKSRMPVPKVLGFGKTHGYNFLLTEFIQESPSTKTSFAEAGRFLAQLHRELGTQHGHRYSNFLASVPLDNQWKTDGIDFMVQNRILPMVGYCLMEEKISIDLYKRIELLCSRLGRIIPDEPPCLLHGDLWTGNLMTAPGGKPVFIDPACHYGYRESELAFTYLFGGFDAAFYEAYLELFPLEPGFGERVSVYHIHPLLVHVYLFGSGYIPGLERILKRFS